MSEMRLLVRFVSVAFLLELPLAAPARATDIPLRNWPVPGSSASAGKRGVLVDVKSPGSFVPMAPCRVADTRDATGPYGGPALAAGVARSFDIDGSPCTGIAPGASAYSLNFTVTGSTSAPPGSFLSVWPTGGPQPLVSTLNFSTGQTLANAAIVPAGTGGSIDVITSAGTHLIIDINGYYVDRGSIVNATESVELYGNPSGAACGFFFASNMDPSPFECVSAVRGQLLNSASGSAVIGEQAQGSGANFGVRGNNASSGDGSAGVLGVSGYRPFPPAGLLRTGVRGESEGGNGVLGLASGTGQQAAVGGRLVGVGGATLAAGYLGLANGGTPLGVQYTGGLAGSGTKSFVEPHPTDASRMIQYYSLEGPESGTYFRGTARTVGGTVTIDVPESFRMVTDAEGLTVQVTPTALAQVAVTTADLTRIVVESSKDVTFHYLVQGERRAYRDAPTLVPNTLFRPDSAKATIPAYLSRDERQRVIANGTYNQDGSVNLDTADRLGWSRAWQEPPEAPSSPAGNRPR